MLPDSFFTVPRFDLFQPSTVHITIRRNRVGSVIPTTKTKRSMHIRSALREIELYTRTSSYEMVPSYSPF